MIDILVAVAAWGAGVWVGWEGYRIKHGERRKTWNIQKPNYRRRSYYD